VVKDTSKLNLKTVLWNVDSLDWADPVPASIAQRVLTQVEKQKRGILLFHDIHDRAAVALPLLLDELIKRYPEAAEAFESALKANPTTSWPPTLWGSPM
jgi:peptidoglycan/xylan/chitin deacetylase (PgdA/CDA1 family)